MKNPSTYCSALWTSWRRSSAGSVIYAATEADWRLFPNLVRFDAISYIGYKCNLRRIEDYPNLSNYLRELYQTPGIAEACDIEGMKRGVFGGAGPIASNGIVPKGPDLGFDRPHDRDRFKKAA